MNCWWWCAEVAVGEEMDWVSGGWHSWLVVDFWALEDLRSTVVGVFLAAQC